MKIACAYQRVMIFLLRSGAWKSEVSILRSRMQFYSVSNNSLMIIFRVKRSLNIFLTRRRVYTPRKKLWIRIAAYQCERTFLAYIHNQYHLSDQKKQSRDAQPFTLQLTEKIDNQERNFVCEGQLFYPEINQMSNQDNTLLDFLKKKSLFSYSPSKNAKRSRSKSQQSKFFIDKSGSDVHRRQLQGLNQKILNLNIPEDNYSLERRQRYTASYVNEQFANQGSRYRNQYQPIINPNAYEPPRKKNELHLHDEKTNIKLWTGLVSYGSNFESARVQSAHCLQALTKKLEEQVDSISGRIEAFNARIYRILMSELKAIQEKIYKVVQAAFLQSEKHVRQYMRKQQQILAYQLIRSKAVLQKEILLIQALKSQLHTTEWRKVAGQILSTNIENKIEGMINQSRDVKAGEWQLHNIADKNLRNIINEIKLIFRLET